jgi:hypothetical protein
MSISCWKALDYPKIDTPTTLLKAFNGHMFQSHGVINTLLIELGGKTIYIVMEVSDAHLEYNLLLDHTWFYEMNFVV